MNKTIYPNIVRGGIAIPLDRRNYFLVKGKTHEQGGIDIGSNPKTGLEVEDGEVVKMGNDGVKVYSAVPMLAGKSPAERVLMGEDPNKVFAAQEKFKKINGLKDDGTKARLGKRKYIGSNEKTAAKQNADVRRQYWNYDTKLLQAVSDISSQYGIDPRIVISRMSREGIIDEGIAINNRIIKGQQGDAEQIKDKSLLDIPGLGDLFTLWGLDTIFDRIKKGYTKTNRPIPLEKYTVENEKEVVNSGIVRNNYDALELLIAELASRQKEVKKQYPNLTADELNSATLAKYHATNKYFNTMMQNGSYKNKYALNNDIEGINIPQPKKYKNKENNVNYNVENDLPTYDIMADYYDKLDRIPSFKRFFNNPEEKINVSRENSFRKMIEDSRINFYNETHTLPYGTNYDYYNPYIDENKEEIKKLGGNMKHRLIEVNIGGNSKLIRVSSRASTGESERSESRRKALLGSPTKKYFDDGTVHVTQKPIITNPLTLDYTQKDIINLIRPMINSTEPISANPMKINPIDERIYKRTNKSGIWGDVIGIGSNIIGSLITRGINNKMINNLKAPTMPVLETARKLNTKYNTNPQEEAIKENLAAYERQVAGNTGSSRIALARINKGRNLATSQLVNLYGQKENIETQLRNQDTMNQQNVAARNIERINRHLTDVTNFNNKVTEMRADNNVSTVQNINQGVQDLLARRDRRTSFNKTLMAQTFANPNLPAELFYAAGIWDKNTYDMYRKQYAKS